ncbi:MAG TPA: hypothetical protein VGX68_07860 [Thermoanaerobaculia bacterium]|nr:hypothetical protein [Thermoanaerobaculia bacterium]
MEVGRQLSLQLRDAGILRRTEFLKVRLTELVDSVRHHKEEVADLNITRVEARIDDDPDVTGFSIAGERAVFSKLFEKLWQEESRHAVIKKCIVRHAIGAEGISVHCDTFGNFRIWVRKEAANVSLLRESLELLMSSGTTFSDAAIPYFRAAETDEQE